MNKYLISADIEGITGVINKNFSKEGGKYYQLGCRYMLSDVNAVIQGIVKADPEAEIIVRDAHGVSAVNLDLERLHGRAKLIQGWGAVQNMLTGLDQEYKGVFLVGFHAGGQNIAAVLGHTMHSIINAIRVNGRLVNETGLMALYAGFYNVPVVFISGDNWAVSEARDQLGDIVSVAVKESYGRDCGVSFSLEKSRALLEKGAMDAVLKLQQKQFLPFKIPGPFNMEIKFYDTGVRVSVMQNLSEILEFDKNYKFNRQEHTMIFSADNVLTMLQRLNMLLFLVYGIQSSSL